jgi:hypothetical protein
MFITWIIVFYLLVHCQRIQVPECPKDKTVPCIAVREPVRQPPPKR